MVIKRRNYLHIPKIRNESVNTFITIKQIFCQSVFCRDQIYFICSRIAWWCSLPKCRRAPTHLRCLVIYLPPEYLNNKIFLEADLIKKIFETQGKATKHRQAYLLLVYCQLFEFVFNTWGTILVRRLSELLNLQF